jgi:nicotinamidase-related amidase
MIYTVIENLTQDWRDRSLDYKLSGFNIAKGSWEARVVDEVPAADNGKFDPEGGIVDTERRSPSAIAKSLAPISQCPKFPRF